ncbi:MAG: hypothetical protein ACREQ9_27010 [Candidatus Binatia bacterium]
MKPPVPARALGFRLAAGFLLALAVAGCPAALRRQAPAPREGAAYFPLEQGSWWLYHVDDVFLGWRFERKVEVTRRHPVADLGGDVIVLEETYTSETGPLFRAPVQPMGFYWRGGYLNALYLSDRDLRPIEGILPTRILPETIEPRMSWSDEGAAALPSADLVMRIDRTHELRLEPRAVAVRAGSFERTVRIDTTSVHRGSAPPGKREDVRFYYSDWYAPGVGLVRSETWDDPERRRLRTRIELVGFATGGAPRLARHGRTE